MSLYDAVLLVDDDPTQIAILSAYFRSLGVGKVHSASDPVIGLEKLASNISEIDLVVSDLQMPNMDGVEFLRHMKDMGYEKKLAIFSGVESTLLNHAAKLATMHKLNLIGHLSKPLDKVKLDAVFKNAKPVAPAPKPVARTIVEPTVFEAALNSGEIRPFYQPKVDVNKRKVVGAEALARWITADGKFISPADFIEYAEQNGKIEHLTFHLFSQTLRDAQTFLCVDPDLKFAINISPRMLSNIDLPDKLRALVSGAGLSSANVSFEVTENRILNLDPNTLEVLSRLRIYGFEVAIDDFGTGSSNIQALRDFPYSELKVDRAFVSKAYENQFSAETIAAAVSFAKQMNMRTVAEGVENELDWEFVRKAGIDLVQGFFVSKALDPLAFVDFINKYHQKSIASADRNVA